MIDIRQLNCPFCDAELEVDFNQIKTPQKCFSCQKYFSISDLDESEIINNLSFDVDNDSFSEDKMPQTENFESFLDELFYTDFEDKDHLSEATSSSPKYYDGLQIYLDSINAIPRCDEEETKWLLSKIKTGDINARNRLVEGNLRLVSYIAIRCQSIEESIDVQDLITIGVEGLFKAIDKYEINSGATLATYASFWIRQNILRFIAENKNTVRIPVQAQGKIKKIEAFKKSYYKSNNKYPSYEIVEKELGFSQKTQEGLESTLFEGISLESYFYSCRHNDFPLYFYYKEILNVENYFTPDSILAMDNVSIEKIFEICNLDYKESDIVKKRFGIGSTPMTLEEVGNFHCLTRERIRQIEIDVLKKMRSCLSCHIGIDFRHSELADNLVKEILLKKAYYSKIELGKISFESNEVDNQMLKNLVYEAIESNGYPLTLKEIISEVDRVNTRLFIDNNSLYRILKSPLFSSQRHRDGRSLFGLAKWGFEEVNAENFNSTTEVLDTELIYDILLESNQENINNTKVGASEDNKVIHKENDVITPEAEDSLTNDLINMFSF